MKMFTNFFLAISFLFSGTMIAQNVPNGSFEEWETNMQGGEEPVGWAAPMNSSAFSNILQVPGYDGSYAAEFSPVDLGGAVPAPSLFSDPFAVDQKYGKLSGYVKGSPVSGDTLYMVVGMYIDNENIVGAGAGFFAQTQEDFVPFNINIYYEGTLEPDSCFITFVAGNDDGYANVGTSFVVDDLELSGSTGIGEVSPVLGNIGNAYPSPASTELNIPFELKEPDALSLTVFDLQGRMVLKRNAETFTTGQNEIRLNISNLQPGTYLYMLTPSDGISTSRTFIVK
ncbi:MAG: T9SS type A sorting domain-containing protein [Bacteroidales bacterium]